LNAAGSQADVLSILIVSWNTCRRTIACLEAIRRHRPAGYSVQVIVVDNASSDDTVGCVRDRFAEVLLIESPRNLGFGQANNIGLREATGEIVLFLNSDTEVTPGFVPALIGEFDRHPEIAGIGCRILGYDGQPQKSVRGFPGLLAHLHSDTPLRWLRILGPAYARYRRKDFDFARWQLIDVAMGAALAFRKSALEELGGFDPTFFMYFEEADLCKRSRDQGRLLAYTPEATVYHVGGESARRDPARMMLVYRQSMLRYFRKHHPAWQVALFAALFKPLFLVSVALDCAANRTKVFLVRRLPGMRAAPAQVARYVRRYEAQKVFLKHFALDLLKS